MYKSLLRIELLSDLCVADGSGYNSSVDIDVCHDEYGLPYIPAKRLKGCLRECAQELNDWGENIPLSALFGERGDRKGACSFRNAYLEKREKYLAEILVGEGNALCHPQNILRNFTYIRSQTSIDHDSGAAEPNSLRAVRVVKKDLVFVANVEWNSEEDFRKYEQSLKNCCTVLKHMGMSRTRGFGSVKVSFGERNAVCGETGKEGAAPYTEETTRLIYEITLKEPVICKSVGGQEQNSLDYIEGAKMLGLIAGGLKKVGKDFAEFMSEDGGIRCSNAYLAKDGIRLHEVPASCFGIKNNSSDYCDKIYIDQKRESDEEGKQLNQMKHCYVEMGTDGLLKKHHVAMEERYHHRRPEDKSIGRADDSAESVFYQMSSISAGQKFRGFIEGSEKQIKQVYDILTAEDEVQLGYGRTSEYGCCEIRVVSVEPENKGKSSMASGEQQQEGKVKGSEFWVLLEAPAILYNDRAFYTTDIKDLREEVIAALGIKKDQIDALGIGKEQIDATEHEKERTKRMRCYVNLTTVGGYNVTWQMRKPTVDAFDKGTVVHFKLETEVELPARSWIGERNAEGYGEISIHTPKQGGGYLQEGKLRGGAGRTEEQQLKLKKGSLLTKVAGNLFQDFLEYKAACDVAKKEKKGKLSGEIKPTIGNLQLMWQSSKTIKEIEDAVKNRFGEKTSEHKKKKKEAAEQILKDVHDNSKELPERFMKQYRLEGFSYDGNVEMEYLRHYLLQMKYKLRKKEAGKQ